MKIDKNQIIKTAKLARLELSDKEMDEFSVQLNDIIEYVEKINRLDTSDVKPADHIIDVSNVLREDSVNESIPRSAIEKTAPSFDNGFFIVPKIIE